ncbi:hypothetical protein COF81_19785 [Bacillus pseudomycoides]|uniref:Uncharacterized protein n=1 Tax=Bacillus pseudomycoides TaxID=64104 RepID=A0ABD6T7B0_9BACI|nr:hypothetical protein [Bacillus pseudomycoides]PHE92499.1 hypothetical protein COF81_19785 [Bacillus pseudomycoides]
MFRKKINDLFNQTTNEMTKMNKEYEDMKTRNNVNSSGIRSSIQLKSKKFQSRKKEKDAIFDFIRNK